MGKQILIPSSDKVVVVPNHDLVFWVNSTDQQITEDGFNFLDKTTEASRTEQAKNNEVMFVCFLVAILIKNQPENVKSKKLKDCKGLLKTIKKKKTLHTEPKSQNVNLSFDRSAGLWVQCVKFNSIYDFYIGEKLNILP